MISTSFLLEVSKSHQVTKLRQLLQNQHLKKETISKEKGRHKNKARLNNFKMEITHSKVKPGLVDQLMSLSHNMFRDMLDIFLRYRVKIYMERVTLKLQLMLSMETIKRALITQFKIDSQQKPKLSLIKIILEH